MGMFVWRRFTSVTDNMIWWFYFYGDCMYNNQHTSAGLDISDSLLTANW